MMVNVSDEWPADEIKHEIMDANLPIITFENPDIAEAKALYGNKRKNYLKKRFKCGMCKYIANRKWMLALHRQWHLTEKPFKCRTCNERFSTRSECKHHSLKHVKE